MTGKVGVEAVKEKALGESSSEMLVTKQNSQCEFCQEIHTPSVSRFAKIYSSLVPSRIIANRNGFIAIPTIGQLFTGSLLILPIEHFETIAELPRTLRTALMEFCAELTHWIRLLGHPILFEHGARGCTGQSCGIYHAHIHLLPVPSELYLSDLLPEAFYEERSLDRALISLETSDTYLLCIDTSGRVGYIDEDLVKLSRYQSQYFRKKLANHFHLTSHWDWRYYRQPEPKLIETLKLFGDYRDTFSKSNISLR